MTRVPDADRDQFAQWELLARAVGRTQQRVLTRVEQMGVPSAWFGVLHELLAHSEHRLPMSRLARELSMSSGGFTKLADRMGQEGLIDRRASPGDRRVVFAALTPDGVRLARKADRVYQAALQEFVFALLPAKALAELVSRVGPLGDVGDRESVEPPVLSGRRDPELPERRGVTGRVGR